MSPKHPKLTLICRLLKSPQFVKVTNGEYRTNIELQVNGGEHSLEIISSKTWAEEIILKKFLHLEIDVTMTNDHVLIYQNPNWHYV